ncbi:FRG domain-containing protein [Pectobacterium polaris]|uniref:FRG domain-containing protein n=1 Tax=Pectobacterium polaris TaxID=2042057 RepID=UPI00158166A0|nr:FRG domain-containing protein [Pectobacterium polaris]
MKVTSIYIFFVAIQMNDYSVLPSLFRDEYHENEKSICNEIINICCDDFEKDKSALDKLIRMQHFGLPTRLLDVTKNPLVALYFSLKENPECNGDVIIFKVEKDKVKHHESDTISCLSNIYNLAELEKNKIREFFINNADEFINENLMSIDKFNDHQELKRLVQFIRNEKPYFLNKIKPSDLFNLFFVSGKLSNPRIRAQSGCFIVFGDGAIFDDEKTNTEHIIVDKDKKNDILNELNKIGVNKHSIFPDITSAAEIIKNDYQKK